MNHNIYPCIWFNNNAKEAAEFYCSVFPHTSIIADTPVVVLVESATQKLMLLNGGPKFSPNPSISFYRVFDNETELDHAWKRLSEGGSIMMPLNKYEWSQKYGWVQDKYDISWQLSYGTIAPTGQAINPTLMYTGNQAGKAEKAIELYTSLFPNSEVLGILRYGQGVNEPANNIKHAQFKLNGYVFMAMDSSYPHNFAFGEGISIVVECDTQQQINHLWDHLTANGGEESKCGWLKDRFGVSWQIIPSILGKYMNDPARSQNVIQAFLQMRKFDIAKLQQAYEQEPMPINLN